MLKRSFRDAKIAVIGLGYVGLPLAVEFGKQRFVVGFDISKSRIAQLRLGQDITQETEADQIREATHLTFSDEASKIAECNTYIITVPTPIDAYRRPDLSFLIEASKTVGKVLKRGDVVIYESTVYPGATEEDCVPVLDRVSGLKFNQDFYAGYSPERINPGDKKNRLSSIVKVTSGSTPEAADFVNDLYASIITAGTYKAESIRVAEAAKIIENTQRDVNIALMNELAIMFDKMGIDTQAVLKAAGTKWNFLPFHPGLVGGHCIGIDPYYLIHKAQQFGYHPQIIHAARRINDDMATYISHQMIKAMQAKNMQLVGSKVLVMGLTFKENCPDLRNTKVVDLIDELKSCGIQVDVYDPWVDPQEAMKEHGIEMTVSPQHDHYDGIVVAVAHQKFKEAGKDFVFRLAHKSNVIFDLKSIFGLGPVALKL